MPRHLAPIGVLATVLSTPLVAQDWLQVLTSATPPGIRGHGMAYDLVNDRTVLFGGDDGGGRIDETWLFDGADWTQATPTNVPGPRAGHPLAYDLVRGRVVLFGGIGVGTGVLNDTWEWDGSNWQQMAPATLPPARLSHPLVYHPGRGTCVVHGGNGLGAGTLTDTWEWNGVDWAQITTANFPTPLRFAADMAFDPVGGGLVIFGGYIGGVGQSDTWIFDNATTDWSLLATSTVPPGRYDHTMVTDVVRNRVVMFGGTGTADTWEFDGADWNQMNPAHLPPARFDDYMVYDNVRGQVVMNGGDLLNDTWVYKTPAQPGHAAAIPYGEGCIDEASATVYETFPPNTFDLSNSTIQMLPTTNNGYATLFIPGAPTWFVPVSGNLGLGDETVSAAQPLGFTLNYPGGSTTDVYISSNGFILGQPGGTPQCCNGDPAALFSGLPRWSPDWSDLNPAAGGTVHFDIDPATQAAIVTFLAVPEWNQPASSHTFQVAFFPSGVVEMRFQNCLNVSRTVLTGWSPGGGVGDPGAVDLSAITTPVVTSPDKFAIRQTSDLRPVLGNTLSLTTSPMPANAVIAATVFGLIEHNPGIDLTSLGMPGCYQYLSLDAVQINLIVGTSAVGSFNVPTSNAFVGVAIKSQGVALAPGHNATGAITSNGVRLTIDVN